MSIPNVFKQYQNKKSHPANSTKTHINSKKPKPTNKTKQKKPHNKKPKTQEDNFSLKIRILTQRDCKNQKSPWSCQQAVWDAWDLTVRLPSVINTWSIQAQLVPSAAALTAQEIQVSGRVTKMRKTWLWQALKAWDMHSSVPQLEQTWKPWMWGHSLWQSMPPAPQRSTFGPSGLALYQLPPWKGV